MKDAIEINRDRTAGALSERAAIVAWLRAMQNPLHFGIISRIAGQIESGSHLSQGSKGR